MLAGTQQMHITLHLNLQSKALTNDGKVKEEFLKSYSKNVHEQGHTYRLSVYNQVQRLKVHAHLTIHKESVQYKCAHS
jgi:hypothetical protein